MTMRNGQTIWTAGEGWHEPRPSTTTVDQGGRIRTEVGDPIRAAVPHSYDHDCIACASLIAVTGAVPCGYQVDRGAELDWTSAAVAAGAQIPPFRIVDNQVPR
jgi:hypothetical protein